MKLWWVGALILAAGVNGLLPVLEGYWQMPLWMSGALILVGALVVIISPSSDAPEEEPAPHPQPPHSDAHSRKAS